MDKGQFVTICIAALAGAIAKELVAWVIATIRGLFIVVSIKAKLAAFFTRANLAILGDVLGIVFYSALLVNFARDPSSPTRLTILLAIGLIFGVLIFVISLLFKLAKMQARRVKRSV